MVDYYNCYSFINMVKTCYLLALLLTATLCAIHPTSIKVTVPAATIHLDYSPDHKYLAMISQTQLKIVLAQTGADYQTQTLPTLTLTAFAFNEDSSWLALGFKEGETHLYQNDGTKFVITDKKFTTTGNVESICFTSDSSNVVVGYSTDKIIVWQIGANTNITTDFGGEIVQSVACSPQNPTLFAVGGGLNTASKLTIYNIKVDTGQLQIVSNIIREADGSVTGITFNGAGTKLFRAQLSGTIQTLDLQGVSLENITLLTGNSIFKIRVTANERIIATHNTSYVFFLVQAPTDQQMLAQYVLSDPLKTNVQSVALSRQGQFAFYVDSLGAGVGLGECDLGTFSDGNGQCTPCDAKCPICDSDPQKCYSCTPRFYLQNNKCENCPVGCATCTNAQICGSCDDNFQLKNNLCQCKTGYYQKGAQCLECIVGCDSCDDSNTCKSCNQKFDLENNKCLCKAGTYLDGKACAQCIRGCANCTNGIKCDKCSIPDHYIQNQQQVCVCNQVQHFVDDGAKCICSDKYYPVNDQCLACPLGCTKCTAGPECSACEGDLTTRDKLCKCPNTDQWADSTFKCTPCKNSLDFCIQCDNADICKNCQAGLNREIKNGLCQCQKGFFEQGKVCMACTILGCEDCSSTEVCITCNNDKNWQLNQASNKCQCKEYYFQSATECLKCGEGCSKCQSATVCTQCDAKNHWVDDGSQACKCMDAYYKNGQVCDMCIAGCLSCQDGLTCNTCDTDGNFVKDADGKCVCKDDHYLFRDRKCVACIEVIKHCDTCELENTCTNCLDPFIKKDTQCLCQDGKYDDNVKCADCPLGCALCANPDYCTDCVAGHNYYLKDNHCIACSTLARCLTCTSQANCLTCVSPFKLLGGHCGCDKGKFVDSGACTDCPQGCTECNSKDVCTACDEDGGFVLEDQKCNKSGISALVIVLIVVGVIVLVGVVFVVIKCIKKRKSPLAEDDYEKL